DLSFPLGSRPYLVPLAAQTPSPFGPLPGGRPLGQEPSEPDKDKEKDDSAERAEVSVDADGISGRVVGVPVVEARYSGLRAVKGGRSSVCVTLDLPRPRFQADAVVLWQHAFAEAGRLMRRDFWDPGMSGVDWDAVLDTYRPLLGRVRGADDFTDLMWEVVAELGTSHAYIVRAGQDFRGAGPGSAAVGLLGADISRDAAGRWLVDRVLPGETSDPRARSPLEAPGVVIKAGDELIAVDWRPVDPLLGPAPLLAGA